MQYNLSDARKSFFFFGGGGGHGEGSLIQTIHGGAVVMVEDNLPSPGRNRVN